MYEKYLNDFVKINDLPKEVEPIVAKNTNLPIEAEPNVAQKDSQIWHVKHGQYLQGFIANNDGVETVYTPYVTLHSALMDTFSQYKYAILILQGCWKLTYMSNLSRDLYY